MAIGYPENEAILLFNLTPYPTLLDKMVSQKLVESRTYSLYLDDLQASTGSIIFGGVDLQKFNAPLLTVPINEDVDLIAAFYISLTGISISESKRCTPPINSSWYPINALLDSGTTDMLLPTTIANYLAEYFGGKFNEDTGLFDLANCDLQNATSGFVTFDFSGIKINVPFNELALPNDTGGCLLGFEDAGSDASCASLGDTFLPSAYVVYDLVLRSTVLNSDGRTIMRFHWHKRCSMLWRVRFDPFRQVRVKCLLHFLCQTPRSSRGHNVNFTPDFHYFWLGKMGVFCGERT